MPEKRWHRFRFYPEGWSNFNSVEECKKPGWCCGCQFKHAFCTEGGRVTEIIDPKATVHEIMAVTGHQSVRQVEIYTKAAARPKMADAAFVKLKRDG